MLVAEGPLLGDLELDEQWLAYFGAQQNRFFVLFCYGRCNRFSIEVIALRLLGNQASFDPAPERWHLLLESGQIFFELEHVFLTVGSFICDGDVAVGVIPVHDLQLFLGKRHGRQAAVDRLRFDGNLGLAAERPGRPVSDRDGGVPPHAVRPWEL